ncbi:MAG: MoaD/ThiS family protein [Bacteroidota bacterium]|nr:MoaD/ThiS family protein [Bacteroidota bacterium]
MKVRLFGILAEKAGTDLIDVDAHSTTDIIKELGAHINDLSNYSFSIAVDRKIIYGDVVLSGNEELAVLPPFAGG